MLQLPRPALGARPNLRHPLCRGLKLFSFLGYGTSAVNLAGPHLGVPTNAPTAIAGVQGPGMRYARASNMRTGFTPNGLATGGDVTAIICSQPALAAGSTFNTLIGCLDEAAGLYQGWYLHTIDNGGIIGVRMIVGDGAGGVGGNLFATGDTTYADGNYHIFSGSYGRGSQEVRVYQDGTRRNQEGSLATYNVAAPAAECFIGDSNLNSGLGLTGDVAWVAVFDRQLTDQEIARWSDGSWEAFSQGGTLSPDSVAPPVIYTEHFRRSMNNLIIDAEEPPVPEQKPGYNPFIPTPSPFDEGRLGGRIVPRVPIRLDPPQSNQGGQDGGAGRAPVKIDPRAVRFTEVVQSVLNGLISSGGIYQAGPDDWRINYTPRQVAGADSFQGELFFSTDTNKLSYKDPSSVIHALY